MPAVTVSGVPAPRLRVMHQSFPHAPRYHKHLPSRPCERHIFLWRIKGRSLGRITESVVVLLHPIYGRTPQPVSCSFVIGNHTKMTAVLLRRGRPLAGGESVAHTVSCFGIRLKSGASVKDSPWASSCSALPSSGLQRSGPRFCSKTA